MEELPTLGSEFSEQLLLFRKATGEESNHPNVFGAKFAAQVRWMLIGRKVADSLPEVGRVSKFEPAIGKGNYVEHGCKGENLNQNGYGVVFRSELATVLSKQVDETIKCKSVICDK